MAIHTTQQRDEGYVQGAVTLEYETKRMTQDRGRKFQLDSMDVNETNFVATAAAVMGEFQRMYVVPEIDAYRMRAMLSLERALMVRPIIKGYHRIFQLLTVRQAG